MMIRWILCAAAITAAAGCSNNNTTTPTTPTTGNSAVAIVAGASTNTSIAYSPNPLTISKGSSVTWTNNDTVTHTSTSDSGGWNSGNLAPGASFTATFATPGTYTYHCQVHPGMIGTVTVQ